MPPLLLALETSSPVCAVALATEAGELLAQAELRADKSHASHLLPLLESLLHLSGYTLADVGAVGLSAGPGSYTGLRIGAATAKGLCAALGVPLVPVSTLRALAWQMRHTMPEGSAWLYCPVLDARRQEVFTAAYADDLTEVSPEAPHILTDDSFADLLLRGSVLFGGSGAAKVRAVLPPHPNAFFLPDLTASAAAVAQLAGHLWRAGGFADLADYEPAYLKAAHVTVPRAGLPAAIF